MKRLNILTNKLVFVKGRYQHLLPFQIADVNAGSLYYASGVVVPSTGWVIFGGASGNETTASLLSSVESSWQVGPDLFENRTDYFNCIVQVQYSDSLDTLQT